MTVVSFTNFRPTPRYDSLPWTTALIYESADEAGPFSLIDSIGLSPVDSDPAEPAVRDFTTENATLISGWYQIVFEDATGDQEALPPIRRIDTAWRPTVGDVSLMLRTRTVGPLTSGLGGDTGPTDVTVFGDDTRPTAEEVERMIDMALQGIQLMVGPRILADLSQVQYASMRHLVTIYAAMLIEASYFRETANAASLQMWQDLLTSGVNSLQDTDETTSYLGFGSIPMTTITAESSPRDIWFNQLPGWDPAHGWVAPPGVAGRIPRWP